MRRPTPEPVSSEQVRELALSVMKADRFPMLATVDGNQPRLRPVSPVMTKGFTVYVANLRSYQKTIQIEANPKVELCYLDDSHDQVRVTGVAKIVASTDLLNEIWDSNPLLRSYLGDINDPQLIIYQIDPIQVMFMREWSLEYHQVDLQNRSEN